MDISIEESHDICFDSDIDTPLLRVGTKRHFENYTGMRFGRLLVIGNPNYNKHGNIVWECVCDCGNKCVVLSSSLKSGRTRSCGCLKMELDRQRKTRFKHGLFGTRIYRVWGGIVSRCCNPNNPEYKYYGGRGITLCKEWKESPEAFAKWAYANGYSENLSIDRIDVNGNYEPSNCRWTDNITQANNKRTNVFIEFNGERHTIAEWSRITGIKKCTIQKRLKKGWSVGASLVKMKYIKKETAELMAFVEENGQLYEPSIKRTTDYLRENGEVPTKGIEP